MGCAARTVQSDVGGADLDFKEGREMKSCIIEDERLHDIEEAVGFKIEDNRDLDYALELLCRHAWEE